MRKRFLSNLNIQSICSWIKNIILWRDNFILWCSGVNISFLRGLNDLQSENIYFAEGVLVLATACIAAFSCGNALWSVRGSLSMAIAFGLFWGTVILNFDRALLMTMPKAVKLSWKQGLALVFRFLFAFYVGYVFAIMLELSVFNPDIQAYEMQAMRAGLQEQIERISVQTEALRNKIDTKIKQQHFFTNSVKPETRANAKKMDKDIEALRTQIDKNTQTLAQKQALLDRVIPHPLGLVQQIEIFEAIKKSHPVVAQKTAWIFRMLLSVEIFPVLIKMLMPRTVYDAALQARQAGQIDRYDQLREATKLRNQLAVKNAEQYYDAISKTIYEELTRASHKQIIQLLRNLDITSDFSLKQQDIANEIISYLAQQIKSYLPSSTDGPDSIDYTDAEIRDVLNRSFFRK